MINLHHLFFYISLVTLSKSFAVDPDSRATENRNTTSSTPAQSQQSRTSSSTSNGNSGCSGGGGCDSGQASRNTPTQSQQSRTPSSTSNGNSGCGGGGCDSGQASRNTPTQNQSKSNLSNSSSDKSPTSGSGGYLGTVVNTAGKISGQISGAVTGALDNLSQQPNVKAINEGIKAAIDTGKNVIDELSKPAYKNAYGNPQDYPRTVKTVAGDQEMRAFYNGVQRVYDQQKIPPQQQTLPRGPASYAQRNAELLEEEKKLAEDIDKAYRDGTAKVIAPKDAAIWTPNYGDLSARPVYDLLEDPVQKVGAQNSIVVVADQATLETIGVLTKECNGSACSQSGLFQPSSGMLGGIIGVANNVDDMASTLAHELTHAGDYAVYQDLKNDLEVNGDNMDPAEKARKEKQLEAASTAYFSGSLDRVSPQLSGKIKDEYLADPAEFRAFTKEINQDIYVEEVAVANQITEQEAKAVIDTIKNNPAMREIDSLIDSHAQQMLN